MIRLHKVVAECVIGSVFAVEMSLSTVDLCVVVLYLVGILFLGLWAGSKTKDLGDYAIAGKVYGVPMLLMTMVATDMDSETAMGEASLMYEDGFISVVMIISWAWFGYWLASRFLFNRMGNRFNGMISAPDIIQKYYGSAPRIFASVAALISGVGFAGIQIMALGVISSQLMGLSREYGMIAGGLITVTYSSLGGIRAVAVTDAVQFVLLISVLPIIASLAMYNVGFKQVLDTLPPEHFLFLDHPNVNLYACDLVRVLCMYYFFGPSTVQRYLMAQDKRQISKVFRFRMLIDTMVFFVVLSIVLSTTAQCRIEDPESVVIVAIDTFVPPVLKGIAVVGILAILMSTIDSTLNTAGIIACHNIARSFFKNKKIPHELVVVRATTFTAGLLAILFALNSKGIFITDMYAGAAWGLVGAPSVFFVFQGLRVKPIMFWINLGIVGTTFLHCRLILEYSSLICSAICAVCSFLTYTLSIYIYNKGDIWDPEAFVQDEVEFVDSRDRFKHRVSFREKLSRLLSTSGVSNLIRESMILTRNEPMITASFICLLYTIPFFMWSYHDPELYPEMVALRLISAALAAPIFFKNYWNPKAVRYFPHYWYFVLFFALGYTSSYMLLCEFRNPVWVCNAAMAVVILMISVPWQAFMLILLSGFALAWMTLQIKYSYTEIAPMEFGSLDFDAIYNILYILGAFLVVGVIFAGRRQKAFASQVEEANFYMGAMAHEARSPSVSMAMAMDGLISVMQEHLKHSGKETATMKISGKELKYMKVLMSQCRYLAKHVPQELSTILTSMRVDISNAKKVIFSARELLVESLNRFPVEEDFKGRIILEKGVDFNIRACREFIMNVFYNMYKNAINHALDRKGDNKLLISVGDNYIKFEDNGKGIKKAELPYIFERFYTSSNSGTGIGLSFCNSVMSDLGGYIECVSKEGEGTTFTLHFPQAR